MKCPECNQHIAAGCHAAGCSVRGRAAKAFVLLEAVCKHFDRSMTCGPDGPGHAHTAPGRWDADGSACEWCATWAKVRECVGGVEGGERGNPPATGDGMTCDLCRNYVFMVISHNCVHGFVDPKTCNRFVRKEAAT